MLAVVEHFYTIQGEGFHTGKAAYFIRLGGCDVGCSWCDTKYSWKKRDLNFSEKDLLVFVKEVKSSFVVITGGEPTMHNFSALTKIFRENNIFVAMETAGCYPLKGDVDWLSLSPKKSNPPTEKNIQKANELKVVIAEQEDFDWAEKNASLVGKNCHLYLQPEWSKKNELLPEVISYVKTHQKWKLSIQSHKYIEVM